MIFKSRYYAMKYATELGILPEDVTILREGNIGYSLYIRVSQDIINVYITERLKVKGNYGRIRH